MAGKGLKINRRWCCLMQTAPWALEKIMFGWVQQDETEVHDETSRDDDDL